MNLDKMKYMVDLKGLIEKNDCKRTIAKELLRF